MIGMKLTLLCVVCLASSVCGHVRLWEPVGRSTAYMRGWGTPVNYDDTQLFCGGFAVQVASGYKCGVCGDPYNLTLNENGIRHNEAGGRWATGTIVAHYRKGQVIDVEIRVTANHWGFIEFKICPVNDKNVKATQGCLDRYVLPYVDQAASGTRYPITGAPASSKTIHTKLKLPNDLVCSQCVIQMRYHAGNSWGCNPGNDCAVGKGQQEEFYACSDVRISENGGPPPQTPPPTTMTYTPPTTVENVQQICSSYTGAGDFEGVDSMRFWCNANCPSRCPLTLCKCA